MIRWFLFGLAIVVTLSLSASRADAQPRIPVVLDFDIGEDIDDVFALATLIASPELELRAITTVGHDSVKRAQMTLRFLTAVGRKGIPVAAGPMGSSNKSLAYWQVQYGNHASVYFRDPKPSKQSAVELLYQQFKTHPGEVTLIAIGPLTNVAKLLTDYPDSKPMIKRIVIMGGSVHRGYDDGSPPTAEYNIAADVKAAQTVFRAGIPLVVAPLDATAMVKLNAKRQQRLFDTGSLLTLSVQALTQLWQEKNDPVLYDPVAVTLAHSERFCTMENLAIDVDDKGYNKLVKGGKSNARVATAIRTEAFLDWVVDRLVTAMPKALPTMRLINEAKMTPRRGMPNRVHVFEDFETDIEKRWCLSGRHESSNVPSGSTRACRAVLTQDFDDRQGETKTLYNAVVFNPVPGPPMGKKPHLSFRYWLKGTDTLRVQIYSLSNGYHRCLMLNELPQGSWQAGNVDMAIARKPDGTGGPLSENERIDDIQFYVDPRAELLIDDIVLYDAAKEGDTRPFPNRFLFTGWFDSGKQGKEWPGQFEIVPKAGAFWNAAKAVSHPDRKQASWILLDLRGDRPIGAATHLTFRYKLEGAEKMEVEIPVLPKTKEAGAPDVRAEAVRIELTGLQKSTWAEMAVDLNARAPGRFEQGRRVREIAWIVPVGAQLLIDDVLLFEPGKR